MVNTKEREEYRQRMEQQKKNASDRLAKNAAYNKANKAKK